VTNLGLGQYASSFEFNLRGTMLPGLHVNQLAQLGVHAFSHQKAIMDGVRQLLDAFARKQRAQKADEMWSKLLGGEPAAADSAEDGDEDDATGELASSTPGGAARAPWGHSGGVDKAWTGGARGGARRATGSSGQVVVLSSSGRVPPRSGGVEELPINLRLPRIVKLTPGGGVYRRRYAGAVAPVPEPSIVPPRQDPAALVAAKMAAAAAGAPLDAQAHIDGQMPWRPIGAPPPTVSKSEWKDLAKSYGLHLLPDGVTKPLPPQDAMEQVMRYAPQPPELKYGLAPEYQTASQSTHKGGHQQSPHRRSTGAILSVLDAKGPDLGQSPSLPMLSPGRPGARNWVTFLHG